MAVYSCNYQIWHTFDVSNSEPISYSVFLNGIEIYRGEVIPFDVSDPNLEISLSEIFREYLDTYYEKLVFSGTISADVPSDGRISTIHTFVVESESNKPTTGAIGDNISYNVIYDYNTDYEGVLPDANYLNRPISNDVDASQRIFISGYNITGASQQYRYRINNGAWNNIALSSNKMQVVSLDLRTLPLVDGDTITVEMTGIASQEYKVIKSCRDRYVVHYVNKHGGIDSILCNGRVTESWNPSRTDIQVFKDRNNRQLFETRRINSDITHILELNTPILTNEGAKLIDNLIYTPKAWFQDIDNNTFTACNIDSSTFAVKNSRYDKPVQYTFRVSESQLQNRR